ncbi:hypothetical protein JIN84_00405 [Luteolibacter yonseiensis]|uniref:Uncharacterized protein n=1 Tax=Luteolibacter yonseiensis TaxID=1144680 RepID=A0A934QWL7_9BACT|nr:hypothetical protein [Luteolibacter yonseiensis]MBK1814068.1 hypothetical protein [Luteolibacter yonseiensis]
MKPITYLSSLLSLGLMLPLSAQVTKTTETTETTRSGNGAVTQTTTTTTQTFNPEARTKVVTYFDQYKTSPHGLPPGFVGKVHVKEIPTAWRTTRIAPGVVITEKERPYLVSAPAELVSVLPAPAEGVRYYVAGSNVVSVDGSYRIVDSVQIPSIKYSEDEDQIEIESKDGRKTTKVEVDKDDGEVEIKEEED